MLARLVLEDDAKEEDEGSILMGMHVMMGVGSIGIVSTEMSLIS